jgi:quercetin dioxygenase-like cupin family protein
MTTVITEADRHVQDVPLTHLFDKSDGATHIWMIHVGLSTALSAGVHRHDGDEIWRVTRGKLRMTINGVQTECAAGQLVVLPPNTPHGFVVLEEGDAEVIGELEMGEWVTVIDPDGSSREVEAHVEGIPWHRPPPEGRPWMGMEEFFALVSGATHLL